MIIFIVWKSFRLKITALNNCTLTLSQFFLICGLMPYEIQLIARGPDILQVNSFLFCDDKDVKGTKGDGRLTTIVAQRD